MGRRGGMTPTSTRRVRMDRRDPEGTDSSFARQVAQPSATEAGRPKPAAARLSRRSSVQDRLATPTRRRRDHVDEDEKTGLLLLQLQA